MNAHYEPKLPTVERLAIKRLKLLSTVLFALDAFSVRA